ncbi:variable surface protein Vir6-like [Plasmodium vivax]|uniref:Variable surface protein Vir6-like n=1 Tax=Plasmodium vivax (strain Salvador I) TaxID=126793 RepID=A5KCV1_PLAVS|nr:variable surface protein Vir6-like [Plasmodium vivax]EDL42819.1 variable surface protein Vir6-like [Plasmodium vivax]|eukprot:XP_001612606.1 variable surface protein Vir6-like [Plasmodium vivax Sal-1]
MADPELDNMLLTFKDYIKFEEKFDPRKHFLSSEVNLNDILHEADITGDTKKNYLDAFKLLLKHVHHDGLFYYGNNPDACKYINYILYKEVEHNIKRSYDKDLTLLFQKFLHAYGKKYGRPNRCISNIYNIKHETYNTINALYNVYDKYKKCYLFNKDTVHRGCTLFDDFFASYDNYMRDTKSKSLKFNEILQNIEEHAKNSVPLYRLGCYNYKTEPRSPKLFKPDPVQNSETHKEVQISQTRLQSVDNIPQYETHVKTHTLQTQLPESVSSSQTEKENLQTDKENLQTDKENLQTDKGNSAHVNHSVNDSHQGTSLQQTIDPPKRADEERTQLFPKFQTPIIPSYFSERPLYSGQHGHGAEQVISKEVEVSSPSVMSTITSALKDVDPVPVVGVSGGMSALFLLFRYTPVGAFFRGGRGRVRRIPSGFHGPFSGEFPNFQDYEGGYIGYGPMSMNPLAE